MSQVLTRARDVAQHLTNLLAGIRLTNGYETDIGATVYRGKRKIDDDAPPCAVLIEGEDRPGNTQGLSSQVVTQAYVLGGYTACDPDNPNDAAHKIISDIKKAVFTAPTNPTPAERHAGTLTFGGRVKKVEYKGRDIGPRADGVPIVFAVVHIEVTFVEDLAAA